MNHFLIDSPTCISFSGGRTSAFMLWKTLEANNGLPKDAKVCFCNTGREAEETLQFVKDCEVHWNIPIIWLEYDLSEVKFKIVSFETANRDGQPFSDLIKKRKFLPNSVMRFCTGELKILTIERYFKSIGIDDFETMVGIRADEPRRIAKMSDTKLMPLAKAGFAQSDIQSFWKANKFDLQLTFRNGITNLGNCDLCFMKGLHQISSLIAEKPERAVWWASQEELIGGRFSKDRPTYAQIMKFTKEQRDMFDPKEETISCFCGD